MTAPAPLSAFDDIAAFPALQRQVAPALAAQTRRVAERCAHFVPRPALVAAVNESIRHVGRGLIAVRGMPGAGATSLFCHLAATRPYLLWLPEDDAGGGLEALCAQLLARYRLPVPLVPPAARRDAATLERLLAAAAARATEPLVVLIDQLPADTRVASPRPFPLDIPAGVVVVYACGAEPPPLAPAAQIVLPAAGNDLLRALVAVALQGGSDRGTARQIARHARGSLLYARLVSGLQRTGLLPHDRLPATLDALHNAWWQALDAEGQRLAHVLAAAGEPLPLDLAAAVSGLSPEDVQRRCDAWAALLDRADDGLTFHHNATRAFISRHTAGTQAAHNAFVEYAWQRSGGALERVADSYLSRQLARHAALRGRHQPEPTFQITRAWIVAQERRTGDMRAAAADAAWSLHAVAAAADTQHLVRTATLAGTLTTLARTLPLEGLAEAFALTLESGHTREVALQHAQALSDQLPDGRDKALALRRLGEVCFEHGMRAPAMRMLASALDLEVPGLPRAWIDAREETLVAFARAAIAADSPDMALGITTRITHAERRGMIETEVVRWLLAHGALTRAEEVAYAINHGHTHEWAMAEVAVGQARAGHNVRAYDVLTTLKTESAVIWALTQLACDAARSGQPDAVAQIRTTTQHLRDRALAQIALALAAGRQPDVALLATSQIDDSDVRARTLIELALAQNDTALLQRAASLVRRIDEDLRTPLVVTLATAHATIDDLEGAMRVAEMLPRGEERDRAYSRVAAALAQRGNHTTALEVARAIPDDDERFWTLQELARQLGDHGNWHQADVLIDQVGDAELRARAEADLAIARARSGHAALALNLASLITLPAERMRAYTAILDPLVQQGGTARAFAVLEHMNDISTHSRYSATLAVALASHGQLDEAYALAHTAARPPDRIRGLVAVARSAATDRALAAQALSAALELATRLGRAETLLCLAAAAEALTLLGGVELLLAGAHALDEVDGWWEVT